jgi:hypothetical protein
MIGWMFKNRWFAMIWVAIACWRVVAFTTVASGAKSVADASKGADKSVACPETAPGDEWDRDKIVNCEKPASSGWGSSDHAIDWQHELSNAEEDLKSKMKKERQEREERDFARAAAAQQSMSAAQEY